MHILVKLAAASGMVLGAPAFAKEPANAQVPAQVQRVLACRALSDSAARLACFDREAGAMQNAIANRDLVAVDRENVRKARRSLFGFSVPDFGIFGKDGDKEEITQVEGVLAGVGGNGDGGFTFRLEDGSRWIQTDSKPFAIQPKRGDKVVIKRGALGSYMLRVGRQPGVKVQRIG